MLNNVRENCNIGARCIPIKQCFHNDIYLEVKGDAKRVNKLKNKFAKRTKRMPFNNQLKIELH